MNHSIVEKNTGSLILNPPENLSKLFSRFNSLSDETNLHDDDDEEDVDKINNCKYDIVQV